MDKSKGILAITQRIRTEKNKFGYDLASPATAEQIARLRQESLAELGFKIPPGYEAFLKACNGLCFNGLTIFGTDAISNDSAVIVPAFVEENKGLKADFADSGNQDLVVFGTGNESYLVYDPKEGRCQRRDEALSNILGSYGSFEELFLGAVAEESII